MSRPQLEVADIIRSAGADFIARNRHWLGWAHLKVLLAITRCRTAALGGHIDECTRCGHRAISYNSCRNRHCPRCQTGARERWIAARRRELLSTPYVHAVFTLPAPLARLALQNKKLIYGLLLRTSADTLLEVARDPRHLGAKIGFFSVLHTWNQKLSVHPHVHCVIPAGGLSLDHTHWMKSQNRFFLPLKVLSRVFRGKFVADLRQAFRTVSSASLESWPPSHTTKLSLPGYGHSSEKTGSSTRNLPLVAPNTYSSIWAATRIAWPSPTIAWSRLRRDRSPFAGGTPLTITNKSS